MQISRLLIVSLVVALGGAANAALLFDRGLPEDNLNNAAGTNRSNIAVAAVWGSQTNESHMYGDDFTLTAGATYKVNKVRVWVVGGEDAPFWGQPISLWGGSKAAGISGLSQLSSTFAASEVLYNNSQQYQRGNGTFMKIWQVDFDTDWLVAGGNAQYFFLGGKIINTGQVHPSLYIGDYYSPYLHAANQGFAGRPMPGADDTLYEAFFNGQNFDTLTSIQPWSIENNPWNKPADFNVQVFGERVVPGPAAVLPFALGLLAAAKRRRK